MGTIMCELECLFKVVEQVDFKYGVAVARIDRCSNQFSTFKASLFDCSS